MFAIRCVPILRPNTSPPLQSSRLGQSSIQSPTPTALTRTYTSSYLSFLLLNHECNPNLHCRLRPAYSSECAIAAIPLRPDSPAWLVREVEETRAGLMRLRQNVVLLADPEDPEAFHPRCAPGCGVAMFEVAVLLWGCW